MRRFMLLAVLAAVVTFGAGPLQAGESQFIHHIDIFQAKVTQDKVEYADIGYHFTAFRFADRIELLGAGIMLDPFTKADDNYGLNFLLTVPVADIALSNPASKGKADPWVSLSFRYGYDFTQKEHVFLAGFSMSIK